MAPRRRYGRRTLFLGAVTAVVLALWGFAHHAVTVSQDRDLVSVDRVTGTVVGGGSEGFRTPRTWVDVRYESGQQELTGKLHGPTVREVPRGTEVDVLVDRDEPKNFRTPDNPNNPAADNLIFLGVPGVGLLAVLAVTISRWWRMRRWTRAAPWAEWTATPGSRRPQGWWGAGPFEIAAAQSGGVCARTLLRSAAGTNFGTAENWDPGGERVLYIPGPGRWGVLLPGGVEIPLLVRLPRSRRQHRRWRRTVERARAAAAEPTGSSIWQ